MKDKSKIDVVIFYVVILSISTCPELDTDTLLIKSAKAKNCTLSRTTKMQY